MSVQVIKGHIVHAPSFGRLDVLENGCIVLNDGKIDGVFAEVPEPYQSAASVDYGDRLVMPSFADMHMHAPQFAMLGMGMDLPLLDWLDTYTFKTEAAFKDTGYARGVYQKLAREMIAKGGDELKAFIEQYSSAKADLQYIHLAPYLRDLLEVGRRTPAPEMIRCPALVIAASSGTFTDPTAMAAWTKQLADGEIATVECAHWPMTECPQEVSAVIEDWIGRHFG